MLQRSAPNRTTGRPRVVAAFGVLVALTVTAALLVVQSYAPALVRVEHFAADLRTAYLADSRPRQHPDIVIVTIDEAVLARFSGHNYRSPIDRAVLARLIQAIDGAGAKAIGLDFIFDGTVEPAKDELLARTLKGAKTRIVLGVADERAGLTPEQRAWQSAFVTSTGREGGHLSLTTDRDGVVRAFSRPSATGPWRFGFAELLARDVPPPPVAIREKRPAIVPFALDDHRNHRIAWLVVDGVSPESVFRTVPALALLQADEAGNSAVLGALSNLLRDKVVIVGGDFPDLDRHATPLSTLGAGKLPGVQLHAHMVAQIIDRRAITHAPPWAVPIVLLVLTGLGFMVGVRWDVERYVYMIGTGLLIALDAVVFLTFRTVMPFTLPLLGWLAGAWTGRNIDLMLPRRRTAI